jgi:Zn-finger nucleic acid-binding protein
MQCPICKNNQLQENEIISHLKAFSCTTCNGNWVRFEDYDTWNKPTLQTDTPIKLNKEYTPVYDSKQANLCPDCGRILIKYKVHNDINFFVDHCGNCNGVWLDKNEWECLITNNLHHLMNSFFTKPWQNNLRDGIAKERFEKQYIDKFGQQDYEKLKNIKIWLDNNENKGSMIAYLLDKDPYKL